MKRWKSSQESIFHDSDFLEQEIEYHDSRDGNIREDIGHERNCESKRSNGGERCLWKKPRTGEKRLSKYNKKILIVDDDETVLYLLRRFFAREQFEVMVARVA